MSLLRPENLREQEWEEEVPTSSIHFFTNFHTNIFTFESKLKMVYSSYLKIFCSIVFNQMVSNYYWNQFNLILHQKFNSHEKCSYNGIKIQIRFQIFLFLLFCLQITPFFDIITCFNRFNKSNDIKFELKRHTIFLRNENGWERYFSRFHISMLHLKLDFAFT